MESESRFRSCTRGRRPSIVNDTTARAILYTGCVAGDAYLVDLRSGRPTREKK